MTATAIADRVAKGISMLNAQDPNWRDWVDFETLELSSLGECILGQVFGSWGRGTEALNITGHRSAQTENGFDLSEDEYYSEEVNDLWAELQSEWIKQIKATSK